MKSKSKDLSNRIFLLAVSIVMVLLVINITISYQYKTKILQQYTQYEKVLLLMSKDDYAEAIGIVSDLKENNDDYILLWRYGICLANLKMYDDAVSAYMELQQKRPIILQDYRYLFQVGEVLFHLNEDELAKSYLQAAIEKDNTNQYSHETTSYLTKINEREQQNRNG